jgi:hypothetical protein
LWTVLPQLHAAEQLGYDPCSKSADAVSAEYPSYWADFTEAEVALVQLDLGKRLMTIVMTQHGPQPVPSLPLVQSSAQCPLTAWHCVH